MAAVNVLLVDDDAVDVLSVKRAFQKHKIANPVIVAGDGVEALAILRGEDGRARLAPPYLILLDLNMPRMNGIEFLGELRADPALSGAIVFVLTTSAADEDKARAYAAHVAGYIVKSKIGEDFIKLVSLIDNYWAVIEFPT